MIKVKLTMRIRQNSEIKSYPFTGIERSEKKFRVKVPKPSTEIHSEIRGLYFYNDVIREKQNI